VAQDGIKRRNYLRQGLTRYVPANDLCMYCMYAKRYVAVGVHESKRESRCAADAGGSSFQKAFENTHLGLAGTLGLRAP
jgi:hypothetical protein